VTTQVRPLAGGTWNNVTLHPNKVTSKATTWGLTLPVPQLNRALVAINQWVNCAGVGTAATRAQKIAAAVRLQIQEV